MRTAIPRPSILTILGVLLWGETVADCAPPHPVLSSISPAGGQAGQTVLVTVAGSHLTGLTGLSCSLPGVLVEPAGANQFNLAIPADALPGNYTLQAVSEFGLSSTRSFIVGKRMEVAEREATPNATAPLPDSQQIPLNAVVNGHIQKGDIDQFTFTVRRGQRVIIDCQAERIDSRLRPILELYDASGKRLAVNRGFWGTDPLIDFVVPADGNYVVKVFDLVYSGSAEHFYRLSLETGPRVAFTVPNVIERGKTAKVTLFGWNLSDASSNASQSGQFDSKTVEITAPAENQLEYLRLRSNQLGVDGFGYVAAGSDSPVLVGLSDVSVVNDRPDHQTAATAYEVSIPCEISGQLAGVDEQDWFAVTVRRGEVLFLETFGNRIGSPVDLDVSVFDGQARELAAFHDEVASRPNQSFAVQHSDAVGRWVAPADGRYLILVRSVIADLDPNPRRQYRLSVRREEPDFQLVAVPRVADPSGINVNRGGSCVLDILALRRRGFMGSIRVSAKNLPLGIECPDVWLGPGMDAAPLVITANRQRESFVGSIQLEGHADSVGNHTVRGGAITLKAPTGTSTLITHHIPISVMGDAPIRLLANGHEVKKHFLYGDLQVRHSPGCIVDVAVDVDRRDTGHAAPVRLTGIGLPDLIENQTAVIPAGSNRGRISFYLPPALPIGKYTLAIQGETTVPIKDTNGNAKPESSTVVSNVVVIDVQPAGFIVTVDPFAPRRVKRGQIVQIPYTARRINGFIGKIHTEPDAPVEVVGLRGRGVTFTGQTETGSIQFIASEDAPLGQQPFLRLYGIGVVEDQPVYHGSCFLNLEIVE